MNGATAMAALGGWSGSEWVVITLAVLAGLYLPYSLDPVLIYFTPKISGAPALEEFALGAEDIPGAVKRYLFPTIQYIEDEGFQHLGPTAWGRWCRTCAASLS